MPLYGEVRIGHYGESERAALRALGPEAVLGALAERGLSRRFGIDSVVVEPVGPQVGDDFLYGTLALIESRTGVLPV